MSQAGAQMQIGERPVYGDVGFRWVLIISVVCHVLLLVVLPFVSTLFVKPKKVERPKTFQLVTAAPVPPAPQRKVPDEPAPAPPDPTPPPPPPPEPKPTPVPTPKPKPPEPTPKPKPPDPKPTPPQPRPDPKPERVSKPVEEESTDELASLLSAMPQPRAQLSAVGVKQDAYLTGVVNKIERNWNPAVENSRISVVVSFTIEQDGTASGVRVTTSSGDGTVDRQGSEAVQRASPFGKLPPHYSGDKVEISITLYPTRRR